MKGKIIGGSSLLLLMMGLACSWLLSPKSLPSPQQTMPIENEEIIAPAIIDSLTDVLRVPALQAGLVTNIHVTVGQLVKKGQLLLSLDDAAAQDHVTANEINLKQAQTNLLLQIKNLEHAQAQLARLKSMDQRAISQSELRDKNHEVAMVAIQVKQTRLHLELSKLDLKTAKIALGQFSISAPKDGIILQINAHVDEHVGGAQPLVYLGDAKNIIVRISIDERDLKNFTPEAAAYLTSNENNQLRIPLTFFQLDHYIITQERLNARVQEALYSFNRDAYPHLVAGQQLDAHIVLKPS
ncbi:MAG: efflux RND transporter periplasmic adaptor subunit [Legionellales bacterium]